MWLDCVALICLVYTEQAVRSDACAIQLLMSGLPGSGTVLTVSSIAPQSL